MSNSYESPLVSRYSSKEMLSIFSQQHKYRLWRKLWISLAKAQKELGLPITEKQIHEMERALDTIPFDRVQVLEHLTQHEVMAHIQAFAEQAPSAQGIIHLGATSSFVMDNGDLIQLKEGLLLLLKKAHKLTLTLASFCDHYKDLPTVGYTHFQVAQFTTLGKRSSSWLQDLLLDLQGLFTLVKTLPFLGVKGAVGSQYSFLELLDHDEGKAALLEQKVAHDFGFTKIFPIATQTYPRKWDAEILHRLASLGSSFHKWATDIRLLSHLGEWQEPFTKDQVGSSAMPHKRNPIYSERVCSLSRLLISLSQNGYMTHSLQWLERSLDDSANRRIVLSEAFLTADAILDLAEKIFSKSTIDTDTIQKNVHAEVKTMASEALLIRGVKKGLSRQDFHERLRTLFLKSPSIEDVILHLKDTPISPNEIKECFDPQNLIGLCPEQVKNFLDKEVYPIEKEIGRFFNLIK